MRGAAGPGNNWRLQYLREHGVARGAWTLFWMRAAGTSPLGRLATRLVAWAHPSKTRVFLPNLSPDGYVAPGAALLHEALEVGRNVFIGDGAVIYRGQRGGAVQLGDQVCICEGTVLETAEGGSMHIGRGTVVMPHCQLMALKAPIRVGAGAQLAQGCALLPGDRGITCNGRLPGIDDGIEIGDGAWIGTGVTVLAGVRIGAGAVIGAGSLVLRDVPANAIAVGAPALIVGFRGDAEGQQTRSVDGSSGPPGAEAGAGMRGG